MGLEGWRSTPGKARLLTVSRHTEHQIKLVTNCMELRITSEPTSCVSAPQFICVLWKQMVH